MLRFYLIIVVFCNFLLLSSLARNSTKTCKIKFSGDDEKFEPIFYTKSKLILPKKGYFIFSNKNISAACTGPKNQFVHFNASTLAFNCELKSQLLCRYSIRGDVLNTTEKCGIGRTSDEGRILKIGFKVDGSRFIQLYEICYGFVNGVSFYAQHSLFGSGIKYASKSNHRLGFSESGLGPDIPTVVYKKTYQKSKFNQLLSSAKLAEKYINDKSFLARGHLSPDADFLLAPWQFSTYYYVNVVPQWQSINNGNWKSLESSIRKIADQLNETLTVFTGTHEVLKLNSSNGEEVNIYLASRNRLPVPKYIWKLIVDSKSSKGIAFVVINNPFTKSLDRRNVFCEDICRESRWALPNWSNITNGYIFCCKVEDFLNYIDISYNFRNVQTVLDGPN